MADRNLPLNRDSLAKIFDSHRTLKWAEDLQQGVKVELPGAIEYAQITAASAELAAASARASAARAQALADDLATALLTTRSQAATISKMKREIAELRALILGV